MVKCLVFPFLLQTENRDAMCCGGGMKHRVGGISVLAFMLAMMLSFFLLTTISGFLMSVVAYDKQRAQDVLTAENLQVVEHWLRQRAHQAAWLYCKSAYQRSQVDSQLKAYEHFFDRKQLVMVEDGGHVFVTRQASKRYAALVADVVSDQVLVSTSPRLKVGRPLIIADCDHATIFQPTAIRYSKGVGYLTLSTAFKHHYPAGAVVSEVAQYRLFVRRKTLYEKVNQRPAQALLEGIDSLYFTKIAAFLWRADIHWQQAVYGQRWRLWLDVA
jgi:hypothetical protein